MASAPWPAIRTRSATSRSAPPSIERTAGVPIKLLPLNGVEASTANVRSGRFPLSRPLNLVTTGQRSPAVEAFLALATSREVNDLVEGQFFVPVAE